MKDYASANVRNIALLGHHGSGKTTFLEAALLKTGVITRLGKVEDGNTVSDYDKMEIEKQHSISMTLVPVEYKDTKINFLDTPGMMDFVGEQKAAVDVADAAVIMIDGSAGIEVGTEKAWDLVQDMNKPAFILVNKIDKGVDMDSLVSDIQDKFGSKCITDDDKDAMDEAVAGVSEELMEKFFEGEPFTDEEFAKGLCDGIKGGDIVPIIKASAFTGEGMDEILGCFAKYLANPEEHEAYPAEDGAEIVPTSGDPCLYVFKTLIDPFLGKISLAKVLSGSVKAGMEVYNPENNKSEKLGAMFLVRGKTKLDVGVVNFGDIVALGKLQNTKTGDTLCSKNKPVRAIGPKFPKPCYFVAIEAEDKNEDEKMAQGLMRFVEEDPTFTLIRDPETHQTLIGGQGDIQINIILAKLKERQKVAVKIVPQKIGYRETIKGNSDVQGKHKKQSGGSGQYGDVHIRFSPSTEPGLEFSEELFGGSVPKNYVPAVEKGLLECMEKGPLAGCKVQNIKAVLYDGSYHDVDSNEVSFKIAASLAFKKGIVEAKPCLLEPIMKVDIAVPEAYTGDVMGDMNKRRGSILGMEPTDKGVVLHAEAPQSELFDYAIVLRAMTQTRGSFEMEFTRYQELPAHLADKVIAAYKASQEN